MPDEIATHKASSRNAYHGLTVMSISTGFAKNIRVKIYMQKYSIELLISPPDSVVYLMNMIQSRC